MDGFERKIKTASEDLHHFFIFHPVLKKFFQWISLITSFFMLLIIVALLFSPEESEARVTDALLTEFNFTNNNTLNYDLSVKITLSNPELLYYARYDHINITAIYKNQALVSVNYTSFSQGPTHKKHLTPSFKGQYSLNLSAGDDLSKLDDGGANYYDIVIKVDLKNEMVKILLPAHKTYRRKFEYTCRLKVPLISNGQSASRRNFNATSCFYSLS